MDGVNSGAEGFAAIFGGNGDDTTTQQGSDSQQGRDAATDASAPDDLSAEERVAASLAEDLEESGVEVPEPGDAGSDTQDIDTSNLDALTPEQLKEIARRALAMQPQLERDQQEAILRQVQDAEASATYQIQQRYQTEILAQSRPHYQSEFIKRAVRVARTAIQQADRDGGDPVQMMARAFGEEFATIVDSMLAYEDRKAEEYEALAEQARQSAREGIPGLRVAYAQQLIDHYGLPRSREILMQIMKNDQGEDRNIHSFNERARDLKGLQTSAVESATVTRDKQRQQVSTALAKSKPVTGAVGGRSAPRKATALKGTADEGVAVMSLFKRD